jgi:DNA-binding transcriptional LysR family regulator
MLENLLTVATTRRVKSIGRSQLKTRQLALLVHLEEERCLARAAAAAGLTQPAASKLLRQVECALDVKLFERHARGMVPTCYGEILVRHARMALSGLGLAREEITALKSGLAGRAAIGAVLSPGTHIVPMAVARVKQRYPGILLSIEIDPSRQLVQRLLQGHLDMVVGRVLETGRAEELLYEPLAADEPHAVIAGAHHPLAGSRELELEDLMEQPWIFPPEDSLVRDKLVAMFMENGLPQPTNIVETLSLPAIISLLEQSNHVVALPEQAVQSCCKAGMLTVLLRDLPLGVGAFGLITRRQHTLSPAAQLLLNTIRELSRQTYLPEIPGPARARTARV